MSDEWDDPEERLEILEDLYTSRFGRCAKFDFDDAENFLRRWAQRSDSTKSSLQRTLTETTLPPDHKEAVLFLRSLEILPDQELKKRFSDYRIAESDKRSSTVPAPDFDSYLIKPSWTVSEAAALLLGKDPEQFSRVSGGLHPDSPAARAYQSILRKVEEFRVSKKADQRKLDRAALLKWAKATRLELPKEVRSRLFPKPTSASAETRRLHTAQRMLLIMAIAKYKFNPVSGTQASGVLSRMLSDAEKLGLHLADEATIKSHLQEAFDGLPASDQQMLRTYLPNSE